MTEWAQRRFWAQVDVRAEIDGFAVLLDGRPLQTPGRAPMRVPTLAVAEMVAAEWRAQEGQVRPGSMPITRAANTAIDRVAPDPEPLRGHLASYAETDLLCYRAAGPTGLVARQSAAWTPLLDWAQARFGAELRVTDGVLPVSQPVAALGALRRALDRFGPFELTALSDLVSLSGSLVIGLAVAERHRAPDALWAAACVDETWQAEQWGWDAEAMAATSERRDAFVTMAGLVIAANPDTQVS